MRNYLFVVSVLMISLSCTPSKDPNAIIDQAIVAHGGPMYEGRNVTFDFRNRTYSVSRKGNDYAYTRSFVDDSLGHVKDVFKNNTEFNRYVNDAIVSLPEVWEKRYSSSVNSVLYFFQLPLGLNDEAVQKKYLGQSIINDLLYEKLKITFGKENGGDDFEDVFIYWINAQTKLVDYLAYSYVTDGGGMRFRQAINRRKIAGIIFQDYVNYKPLNNDIDLENLDESFNQASLIDLSQISNENIKVRDLKGSL